MEYDLINTIVFSFVLAFLLGLLADRLKMPTIFGYLCAGIMLGPFTPGLDADVSLARQLAEIGIILLMFGVGLHFSFRDLLAVQKIAIPGAVFQIAVATVMGMLIALIAGHPPVASAIYGFSLSVASTIVLLRTLERRQGGIDSHSARVAVGWLIVEDIIMVLALVIIPIIAYVAQSGDEIAWGLIANKIVQVIFKIALFIALMLILGRKLLPTLLMTIRRTKSPELMTLGTLAIALGFAYLAYTIFDASFALGAFLAGMVLKESDIGRRAAEQSLPMRDAFAVLFFVSVGMLFDPETMLEQPVMVLLTLLIIVFGKIGAALLIAALFRQDRETGATIAVSLAQIGEFSFILAGYALSHKLIAKEIYDLVLAGALLSIALNPFLFRILDRKILPAQPSEPAPAATPLDPDDIR